MTEISIMRHGDALISTEMRQGQWIESSREQVIPTNLGGIGVRIGGIEDGPVMVFWPSLIMTGAMWRYQYEHFAPSHKVVLIDPPGIGKSTPLARTITLEECSDCLLQVLDALGIVKCFLIGNSWGAILASVFAAWHPERLSGVVAAGGTSKAPTLLERIKLWPLITALGLHRKAPRWLATVTRSTFEGDAAKKAKPLFRQFFHCVLAEDPRSIAFQMKSILLKRKDTRKVLRTISEVPVLVVAGDEDKVFSIPVAQAFADAIPVSKFVILPQTGHLPPLESPELFNRAIESFIMEQSSTFTDGRLSQ